ncbi:YbaB/EbfC DNA-binding family protein [Micromonospora echinaurantiaca]|uniref:YbaB/EbfC DNA-binding family protein n=1 Tax=Micromonospora echinaurantiaca TaxID=47857 RepID=A0A1C5GRJ8_9ACTN|nr:YbaB/EbfC family nucleoid-associated protein [Micromonospora echinaurantiaca]SCG36394.1 YbaB/EbfC DNA-binding family protein [Micromonospora echinaurantiaca]
MTAPNGNAPTGDVMAQLMERMREQLSRGEELRTRLAGLTGRAESEDGLVRVTCTAEDPAHELHLDPRALRLPATDLAELIADLLRKARADLQRETSEALRELTGPAGPEALVHDPAAAQAKLAQLNDLVSGPLRESTQMLERLRRQLGV